ncbi:MAG: hypothetical protein KC621_32415, partial [Myxococcales bacterium]|nr:hypothetical protein [Myxococcales bacterium]
MPPTPLVTLWVALTAPASAQSVFVHYDFDGTGVTSGGHVFADDSGNGNDGVLVDNGTLDNGAYVTSPAAFGQAWNDPGEGSLADGDRVDLSVPYTPDASTPWTVSFWMDMYGGAVRPLFDPATQDDELYVRADSVNEVSLRLGGQGTVVWDTAGIVNQRSFAQYTLVADPGGIAGVDQDGDGLDDHVALYVDGVLMATTSTGLSSYATPVTMTAIGDGSANNVFARESAGVYDELWVVDGFAMGAGAVWQLHKRNHVCWSTSDGDGDGVPDDCDLCPSEDASHCDPDANGCIDDADSDGLLDCEEDLNGDDVYDEDTDLDGV